MKSLENRVALVTGAMGGIGSASVRALIAEGALVALADLDVTAGKEAFADLDQDRLAYIRTDVSQHAQVRSAVEQTVTRFGRLDIMFNNAGIGVAKPLLEHDPDIDYHRVMRVNQDGVYYGILEAAKQFVAQGGGGVIINTSSIYGQSADDAVLTYSASKAAVTSFTRSAAMELAPHEIRVVAISPGRVRTPMLTQFSDEQNAVFSSEQLRGRQTEPAEIASVVAFLASEKSNAINGTVVNVDDGYSIFKHRATALSI